MADNYEAVDMEESDGSGSDNEAFPNKQEYKAYKEQFNVAKVRDHLARCRTLKQCLVLRQSLEMQRWKMNMEGEEVLSMAAVGRYLV